MKAQYNLDEGRIISKYRKLKNNGEGRKKNAQKTPTTFFHHGIDHKTPKID
jgi:hypothetical protein